MRCPAKSKIVKVGLLGFPALRAAREETMLEARQMAASAPTEPARCCKARRGSGHRGRDASDELPSHRETEAAQ